MDEETLPQRIPNFEELLQQDLQEQEQQKAQKKEASRKKKLEYDRRYAYETYILKEAGLLDPTPAATMSSSAKKRAAAGGSDFQTPAAKRPAAALPAGQQLSTVQKTIEKRQERRASTLQARQQVLADQFKADKEITAKCWKGLEANSRRLEANSRRLEKNRDRGLARSQLATQAMLKNLDEAEKQDDADDRILMNFAQSLPCHTLATPLAQADDGTPARRATATPSSLPSGLPRAIFPDCPLSPLAEEESAATTTTTMAIATTKKPAATTTATKKAAATTMAIATTAAAGATTKRFSIMLATCLPTEENLHQVDATPLASILPKAKSIHQVADCTVLFTLDGQVIPAINHTKPGLLGRFFRSSNGLKFNTEPIDFDGNKVIIDVHASGKLLVASAADRKVYVTTYQGGGQFATPRELPGFQATEFMGVGETTVFGFKLNEATDTKIPAPLLCCPIDGSSELKVEGTLPQSRIYPELADGSDRYLMVVGNKNKDCLLYSRSLDDTTKETKLVQVSAPLLNNF